MTQLSYFNVVTTITTANGTGVSQALDVGPRQGNRQAIEITNRTGATIYLAQGDAGAGLTGANGYPVADGSSKIYGAGPGVIIYAVSSAAGPIRVEELY
jgi:hypothetical protein